MHFAAYEVLEYATSLNIAAFLWYIYQTFISETSIFLSCFGADIKMMS